MQNKLTKLFYILVILLICITTNIYSQNQFVVQTIYFKPTDAVPFENIKDRIANIMNETQQLYADEMERNGFNRKTFKLERDGNNKIKIHLVNGKNNTQYYIDKVYDKLLPELPDKFNPNTPPVNKQDSIRLIIVGGINFVSLPNIIGLGWGYNTLRYGGEAVVVANHNFTTGLVFHELGHCFGLYHIVISIHLLEDYEARWLDKHYHFNNKNNNFTYPKPIHKNPTLTDIGNDIIKFELPVISDIGLYQAQIFNVRNIIVLDWDYFNGEQQGVVSFEIPRHKWSDLSAFQIMDTGGNYHMAYIDIVLPEEKDLNKNPDLPIQSTFVKKDLNDNVVYLTINKGGKNSPNEHGIKPINPIDEYKNGWGAVNITDDKTNNGNPIIIQSITFEKGISLTPPDHPNSSILKYDLTSNNYIMFQGYIGIADDDDIHIDNHWNQSCNVGGTSIFTFKIDKKEVYKSDIITGKDSAVFIEFDIPLNSKEFEIILDTTPDGAWCDRPSIGDAKLISDEDIISDEQISVKNKNKLVTTWAELKQ